MILIFDRESFDIGSQKFGLGGGSDAERLMSTLAYGWVERCNDVASCRKASSSDKYSCAFNLYNCICFINYYEHDECLNVLNKMYLISLYLHVLYICICFYSNAFYVCVHGARSLI